MIPFFLSELGHQWTWKMVQTGVIKNAIFSGPPMARCMCPSSRLFIVTWLQLQGRDILTLFQHLEFTLSNCSDEI